MLLPLHPPDVIGSVLYFPMRHGAVGTVVLWLVGRVGRTRRSQLAAGPRTSPALRKVTPPSPLPGQQQQQPSAGRCFGTGAHSCCVRTPIQPGSVKGSGVLNALERCCSQCPHLNLFHLLTMSTLSLRENRSSAQAPGYIGQE